MIIKVASRLLTAVFLTLLAVPLAEADLKLVVQDEGVSANTKLKWTPLAIYIEKNLGERVRVEVMKENDLTKCIRTSCAELFFTDPTYLVDHQNQDVDLVPLATRVNNSSGVPLSHMAGVVLRSGRRDVYTFADTKNLRMLITSNSKFVTRHAVWREMVADKLKPEELYYRVTQYPEPEAVVESLLNRSVHLASIPAGVLERMIREGALDGRRVKVLEKIDNEGSGFPFIRSTRLYPEWPVFALKSVPAEKRKKVKDALLSMPKNSSAARASKVARWIEPLSYDDVEECLKEIKYGSFSRPSAEERLKGIRKH